MLLYPNTFLTKITDITIDFLENNNIQGLILDVDNTMIDYNRKPITGLEKWCNDLKSKNIKLCILSNSNKKEKVKTLAENLEIPFIYFACKPFKKGFLKSKRILGLENENIAVVGDQIFTDVLRCKQVKDVFHISRTS